MYICMYIYTKIMELSVPGTLKHTLTIDITSE